MALNSGTRLGPYEITGPIGAGGMGEVYRATDTNLDRPVAIKVLPEAVAGDAERLARFDREARTLAALNHPNIAQIYGVEKGAGQTALVMELVEGPTLADRLKQGPIAVDEALPIARQIAEALEAAHAQGIIHRDLKPANIKLRADGTVKVLDFGLAKAMEPAAGTASASASMSPTITTPAMSQAGVILGTAAYMSPEQARGKPVDRRTDIWAFGCVLYEMLTGARPFPGDDVSQTLARVIERDPDWTVLPAAVPAPVRQAIRACLQKAPERRPRDASDVCLAMDGAFDVAGDPSAGAGPGARSLVAVGLVALVAGAIVGAGSWALTRPPTPSPPVGRFVIQTPVDGGLAPVGGIGQVAISPDGTRVAYGAAVPGGTQVYTRAVGELQAIPLRGAEGGISPAFSPDGQSIAFAGLDDFTVRRVPVAGGPPQTIATFDSLPFALEWAPDDTIFVTRSGNDVRGLQRVPAGGGAVEDVTVVDTGAGDVIHGLADMLPGGEAFLFVIYGPTVQRLAAMRLDTREIVDLGIDGTGPSYVPSGHLLYSVGDGTLRAVGFDLDRLAVTTTTPVPVVENVHTPPEMANAAVSDQGSLVYVTGAGVVDATRELLWVARDGREEAVGVAPGQYLTPRVSPDGTRVAVSLDDDIWVTDLARPGTLQRVTTDPARDRFPVWSPDGQRLFFESNRNGTLAILAVSADGRGDVEPVLVGGPAGTEILSPESWSADGREILFVYRFNGTNLNLGAATVDGTQTWRPVLDTDVAEGNGVISPDGQWIAYEADDSGQFEIYIERFPSLGGRQVVSAGGGRYPVWSRDGHELYYRQGIGGEGPVMASAAGDPPAFAIGAGRELLAGGYYYPAGQNSRSWDVAPDGRFLVMNTVEAEGAPEAQIILIQNWLSELERLVPVD
jgi:serine/threonine-protein kinase